MTVSVNDFFCGAGGMAIGFQKAGFDISGSWDFDEAAVQSYKHNVEDHVKQADIREMSWEDVPTADVWTFGFPCQDLSKNGKRAGILLECKECSGLFEHSSEDEPACPECGSRDLKAGSRSGLFYEVMRLLDEVQENNPAAAPAFLLAENVRGLSKYIPTLEAEYKRRGYKMTLKLYDSIYWGVPQKRERYYVAGVRDDLGIDFELPEEKKEITATLWDILEDDVDEKYYANAAVITVVKGEIRVKQATKKGYDVAQIGDAVNISHPKSKTRRGRVGKQRAQTILTSPEQLVILPDGYRYFTPREYLRLQGFPDSFEMVVPETEIYKQAGNAVTVNLAQAVAEKIKEALENGK